MNEDNSRKLCAEKAMEYIKNFKQLNDNLNDIVGVIGTSLFMREVTKLIVAGDNGIRVLSK